MYRTIWSYYFITGLLSLSAGVPAMNSWAAALLPQEGAACPLADSLAHLSAAHVSLCLAAWVNEARGMAGTALGVLADIHGGMKLVQWMHVVDVVLIAAGILAAAFAVIWLWANAMTRLAGVSLTGTYTLVRAVGLALERR